MRHTVVTTLKGQFLAYGFVTVVLAVVVTGLLSLLAVQSWSRNSMRMQMLSTGVVLASGLEPGSPQQNQALLDAFQRGAGTELGYDAVVVDSAGTILAATEPHNIGKPLAESVVHREVQLQQVLAGELEVGFEEMTHRGLQVLDLSLPLRGDPANPSRVTGALHLTVPYQTLASLVWPRLTALGLSALLLAGLLVVPLWYFVEWHLLRPLRVLTAANRAVSEGRSEARQVRDDSIPQHELGEFVRSRNEMLARLEAADAALRRRLRELSELSSTAALLSQSTSIEELLRRTLDKVLQITGFDAAEVSLFESRMGRLVVRVHRGFSPDGVANGDNQPGAGLIGPVADQRLIPWLVGRGQVEPFSCPACNRAGGQASCTVPLEAEGQILGTMTLYSHEGERPSAIEQDLLEAIAGQVAVALMNVRLYDETRRLATTDALTGLANRRVLEERLSEELRRTHRYGRPLSVIMADLDHFKLYNDTHGHATGDVVLRELALLLRATMRETDVVARYGGEEFVLLLPETSRAAALLVAEKIRDAVESHSFPNGETQPTGRLTISVGVAAYPDDLAEPVTLLDSADLALYRAKEQGRNRVCTPFSSPSPAG